MNTKKEVLRQLFLLNQEDILDIYEILHGYKCSVNKSKNDSFATRLVYMNGYHSLQEFYKKFNLTKDDSIAEIVSRATANISNVKSYLRLKNMLDLDDVLFLKLLSKINIKGDE